MTDAHVRSIATIIRAGILAGLFLLLLMPLIVTQNQTLFPFIVGKSIFARSLIEIVTALWVILALIKPEYRPRRSWVLIAFGVWVFISFVASLTGVSFTRSIWSNYERMTGVWDLFHWFLLALVAGSVLRTHFWWDRLLNWNLVVVLVLSVIALGQAYDFTVPLVPSIAMQPRDRVDATLGNPSFLAAILAVNVMLALGFLARS